MNPKDTLKQYNIKDITPFDIPLEYMDLQTFFAECEAGAFKPHIHGFYQITWFRKGEGVHLVDFKE